MRVVEREDLEAAMLDQERSGATDAVPFTSDEVDEMASDPCYYGYHSFTSDDPEYEGLMCSRGCGYGIG